MSIATLNELLFKLNIFKASSWVNLFAGIKGLIGRVIYTLIIVAIGRISDICQLVFKKLAGISPSGIKFQGVATNIVGDPVIAFLNTDLVKNLFFALLVLAVVMLVITTFVATIKTEFAKDGNNNKRIVIKHAFRGLANFILVPVICLFGLIVGNALLRAIDGATSIGGATSLSSQIFMVGAYNANRARKSQADSSSGDFTYKQDDSGLFGRKLKEYGNFGVFLDDTSGINRQSAADKIDDCFAQNHTIFVGQGYGNLSYDNSTEEIGGSLNIGGIAIYNSNSLNYEIINDMYVTKARMIFEIIEGVGDVTSNSNSLNYDEVGLWNDGACTGDLYIKIKSMTNANDSIGENVGLSSDGILNFKEGDAVFCSIYNIGLVYYYYDLSLTGGFDYIICTICLLFCAWTLLLASLGLIKRLFMTVTLFLISPPICATYPIDGGKILERWRTEFVKNALSAYSTVVVMNIFLSLLPLVSKMKLFISYADILPIPIPTPFANYIAKILIVIGGLVFFKEGSGIVAQIIGAGDTTGDGAKNAGAFGKGVGRFMAGGALVAGIGMSVGKSIGNVGKGISGAVTKHNDNKFRKEHEKDADITNQLENNNGAGDEQGGKFTATASTEGGKSMNGNSGNKGASASGSLAGGDANNGIANSETSGKASGGKSSVGLIPMNKDGTIDYHAWRMQSKKQKRNENIADKGVDYANKRYGYYQQKGKSKDKALELAQEDAKKWAKKKQDAPEHRKEAFKKVKGVTGSIIGKVGNEIGRMYGTVKGLIQGKLSMADAFFRDNDDLNNSLGFAKHRKKVADKQRSGAEKAATTKMRTDINEIAHELKRQREREQITNNKLEKLDSKTSDVLEELKKKKRR